MSISRPLSILSLSNEVVHSSRHVLNTSSRISLCCIIAIAWLLTCGSRHAIATCIAGIVTRDGLCLVADKRIGVEIPGKGRTTSDRGIKVVRVNNHCVLASTGWLTNNLQNNGRVEVFDVNSFLKEYIAKTVPDGDSIIVHRNDIANALAVKYDTAFRQTPREEWVQRTDRNVAITSVVFGFNSRTRRMEGVEFRVVLAPHLLSAPIVAPTTINPSHFQITRLFLYGTDSSLFIYGNKPYNRYQREAWYSLGMRRPTNATMLSRSSGLQVCLRTIAAVHSAKPDYVGATVDGFCLNHSGVHQCFNNVPIASALQKARGSQGF